MKLKDFIYVSSNSKFEVTYTSAGETIKEVFTYNATAAPNQLYRLGELEIISLKAVDNTFIIKASI